MSITDYLSADHQRCDTLFADAEAAAAENNLAAAETDFAAFLQGMLHHLAMEENVLFPAFEQASGNSMGPTRMMRMEHEQMRELFTQMGQALACGNTKTFAGLAETLLILMQQHNLKEEQILYPMSDRALGDTAQLIAQMQAIK